MATNKPTATRTQPQRQPLMLVEGDALDEHMAHPGTCPRCQRAGMFVLTPAALYCDGCGAVVYHGEYSDALPEGDAFAMADAAIVHLARGILVERMAGMERSDTLELECETCHRELHALRRRVAELEARERTATR